MISSSRWGEHRAESVWQAFARARFENGGSWNFVRSPTRSERVARLDALATLLDTAIPVQVQAFASVLMRLSA